MTDSSSKVKLNLSTISNNKKKRSRVEPSPEIAFDFLHDDDEAAKRHETIHTEPNHHRDEVFIIPLHENDKTTLLERRNRMTSYELAAEALTQSALDRFSENGTGTTTNTSVNEDLIISSGGNNNLATVSGGIIDKDKEFYLKELDRLPDEADDIAYARVPVSEFGAALLRGMGWNAGADSPSSKAPQPPARRPARLGLGATPKMILPDRISGKIRTQDQAKRDDALRKQQAKFDRAREERLASDKQHTLQLGSLVYYQGRRAKVFQLNGVPGLSRALVQVERETTITNVKKGDLSLIPRSDLEERPFEHTNLPRNDEPRVPDESKILGEVVRSNHEGERKRGKQNLGQEMHSKHRSHDGRGWLITNIRVRVITRRLGPELFKEKGVVVDVAHRHSMATVQMSNGQVLDQIPERYLETALPKLGGNVIVLSGESKFGKGTLLERDSKSQMGVIQMFEDLRIVKLSLDDLAEWVGPLDDDMLR